MSYDIYGESLRCGHCEVHPHVHEEYPCSVCIAEKHQHDSGPAQCNGDPSQCESAHYLGQAQEEITRLQSELAEQCRIVGMGAERELALRAKNERLRAVLAVAHDRIDMSRLAISHCKDAALIRAALAQEQA